MERRKFIKIAASTAAATGVTVAAPARAMEFPVSTEPVSMLYDSTLCVGCQACVAKCQTVNYGHERNPVGVEYWSENPKLSAYARTVIQKWSDGDAKYKDQESDGFAYVKKACMHCVIPNCVLVCPVTALTKDEKTGVVYWHADVCTGCRNCMIGCPYNVPQYDYDDPFGKLYKCEFCNQPGVERLDKGQLPGCVEVCPTGAIIYGTRDELLAEAKKRLTLKPGEMYSYPRQLLPESKMMQQKDTYRHPVATYQQHIYGETEGGGTQVLMLSGVPFENLGMPALEDHSTGLRTANLQHTLYKGLYLPAAALACITAFVWRNERKAHKEHGHKEGESHE